MAAPVRAPRSSWIEEGLRALAVGGPDAVRVATLARTLGVTKGAFYWQFEGRRALLEEMLDAWEQVGVDAVIEQLESEGGDARDKLRRLFALASVGDLAIKMELAIRDWAGRDKAVARRLLHVDKRRLEYMRSLFGEFCRDEIEVDLRCLFFVSLLFGNHFISADITGRGLSRAERNELALRRLLA
jgi:AcrR family transcriptional regulator